MIWTGRIAAIGGGLALAIGATGAQATAYRNWRVVYHVSLKVTNEWIGGLVAPSRDQAWTIGFTVRSGRISGEFLDHWNGSRWRMIAVPGINLMPDAVAASGPGNVWLFSSANRAFTWDGHRWAPAQGTVGMPMGDPVVLSSSDVWTTGGRNCDGTSAMYNWTGSGWVRHTVPGAIDSMSGSSSSELWVLTQPEVPGTSCRPLRGARLSAFRWDGTSFKRVDIPRVVNGKGQNGGKIAVASAHDIWIANIANSTIVHWNGHRWIRLNVKAVGVYIPPSEIVPDGRGGAFVGGCWHWSGGVWHPIYASDGCDESFGIARIPGTRSAWRLGRSRFGGRLEGTIEVNGPLP